MVEAASYRERYDSRNRTSGGKRSSRTEELDT